MHALDAALVICLDPKLRGEQLNVLRDLLVANNETVMVEYGAPGPPGSRRPPSIIRNRFLDARPEGRRPNEAPDCPR